MATIIDNHTGVFTQGCPPKTKALLFGDTVDNGVGLYLQYKIARMKGCKPEAVVPATFLTISTALNEHSNSEGVIFQMQSEKGFVPGLRIDLQKPQTVNGQTYATFQVQWGTGMDGKTGGAYCGALLRVDHEFTVGDLGTALLNSLNTQTYWRIDP